jgi:hypothetical protein
MVDELPQIGELLYFLSSGEQNNVFILSTNFDLLRLLKGLGFHYWLLLLRGLIGIFWLGCWFH